MGSRLASLVARFHTKRRESLPVWATEITEEVRALAHVNRQIVWATESTGLLTALRTGLESLDEGGKVTGVGD
jgi:hypothetical protein